MSPREVLALALFLTMAFTGAPPGERCPTPSRREGGYAVVMDRTAGRPGTMVVMAGNTPLFGKSGRYVGPTGRIGFWFNLPFNRWMDVYSSQGPPMTSKRVPVIHIGEVNVAGQCSYRLTFRVPEVPPGTYLIVPIEHGGGGFAAFRPIEFSVT